MLPWLIVAWLWLVCGILVWREYYRDTGIRSRTAMFGLVIFGPPIVSAKMIVETFTKRPPEAREE